MDASRIAIIGAPLDLGQDRRGVDMGPSAVRVASLNSRVASLGYEVDDLGNIGREPLVGAGWQTLNAPNGKQWMIHPDVVPLWENAVNAKGLWAREDTLGSTFRAWMKFKNIWVPIKLAASMFHPPPAVPLEGGLAGGQSSRSAPGHRRA